MFTVLINRVIRTLVLGDVMFFSAFGLISPIFAIFITGQVKGATIATAGFAATINLVVRSALQMPIARYIDKRKGEKDDFLFMVAGSTLVSIVPFVYIFVDQVWQLYLAQALYGLGGALASPGWYAIFTRHIDKSKESTEWTLENVGAGIASAAAAALGGIIAERLGFHNLFLVVGILSLVGLVVQISLYSTVLELDHGSKNKTPYEKNR